MKTILSRQESRLFEQRAINTGMPLELLVERAGKGIASFVSHFVEGNKFPKKVLILAGKGNNGADGYAAGRLLIKEGFEVAALEVLHPESDSLCAKKKQEFTKAGGLFITSIEESHEALIIDAIFGTGFQSKQPMDEKAHEIIALINRVHRPVIAVDIPSGLDADTGEAPHAIVASVTLAIHAPKVGFFINDGFTHIGALQILPIGLDEPKTPALQLLEGPDAMQLLPPISRIRHKYNACHVITIAGSHGMCGAALMASYAALKSGAGIVHLVHDASLTPEISGAPWEIIRVPVSDNLEAIKKLIDKASFCCIGPGLGVRPFTENVLAELHKHYEGKVLLDADALNVHAQQQALHFPKNAILTPHRGEMARLLKIEPKEKLDFDFLKQTQKFAEDHGVHIVLKGAPTFLFSKGKPITIAAIGDPGMATAGSGDVLSGIISSFAAQGLEPYDAMQLGVFLHGVAGITAAQRETSYAMTATSIIHCLPEAFQRMAQIGHFFGS